MTLVEFLSAPIPTFGLWASVIIAGILLAIGVALHELAHYAQLRKYGIKATFSRQGLNLIMRWDRTLLNAAQTLRVYYAGIIAGLLPLMLLLFVSIPAFLICLFLYGVASWYDITELRKIPGDHTAVLISFLDKKIGIALLVAIFIIMILSMRVPTYVPVIAPNNLSNITFNFT